MPQPEIVNRGPVGQVTFEVPARQGRPLTLREQRESLVRRILEEHARSGTSPGTLRELVEAEQAHRWAKGEPLPREQVEKYVHEYVADLLARDDAKRGVA